MTLRQNPSFAERQALPRNAPERRNSVRFAIFVLVFLASAAASLLYVYQRPAVYQATASLLVTPPADRAALAAALPTDPQAVGFERHALMTNSLLELLSARLTRQLLPEDESRFSVPELQKTLRVERFEETNIVRLWARGNDPAELPLLLNNWIEIYLEIQTRFQESLYSEADRELARQADEMQIRVETMRVQLANFRQANDIVSLEREENRVVSRLRGLSTSLDRAEEDVVKASSELDAIIRAVARGDIVADREDKLQISQLEDEVAVRRTRIAEFRQRFTEAFIPLDRDIQLVMEELKIYEQQLEQRRLRAADRVVGEARRALASARQTAEELTRQLVESEQEISSFSAIFAEHEALKEELTNLETDYQEITQEQVRRQVDRDRAITQVEVLERANEPTEPTWPNYTRDAAIAVGGSALLSFIIVLLYDFFTRPPPQAATPAMEAITIGTVSTPALYHDEADFIEERPAPPRLTDKSPPHPQQAPPPPELKELSVEEVHRLLRAAEPKTRALIALLLSGVSGSELISVAGEHLDLNQGTLTIPGLSKRTIVLSEPVRRSLTRADFRTSREGQTILRHQNEEPFSLAELDGLLARAADEAGLAEAGQLDSALLRQSYLAFLVRQGADLLELQETVGRIPPASQAAYAAMLPEEGPQPADQITLIYPGLEELA